MHIYIFIYIYIYIHTVVYVYRTFSTTHFTVDAERSYICIYIHVYTYIHIQLYRHQKWCHLWRYIYEHKHICMCMYVTFSTTHFTVDAEGSFIHIEAMVRQVCYSLLVLKICQRLYDTYITDFKLHRINSWCWQELPPHWSHGLLSML
jgi:hypothetical protein